LRKIEIPWESFAVSLISLLIGFLVGGIILAAVGVNPLRAYAAMFHWALRRPGAIFQRATPILLTALSFAVAARANIFNIGAEGQMYLGALASLYVAVKSGSALLSALAGLVAGMGYASIAGFLKSHRGVNEVISTIMLNWIAFFFLDYSISRYLADPSRPWRSVKVPVGARIPYVGSFPLSFVVAVIVSIAMYFLLWRTSLGYDIRAVGLKPKAARYGGADVKKITLLSMSLAGVAGGLAGSMIVQGQSYYIDIPLSVMYGMGFDGIGVSLIGRNHPLAIVVSALFFGVLMVGSHGMQLAVGVPREMVTAVIGIIIIALAMPEAIRMIRRRLR